MIFSRSRRVRYYCHREIFQGITKVAVDNLHLMNGGRHNRPISDNNIVGG